MLNKTQKPLLHTLLDANPKDVSGFIDYDDCLEQSTVRNLTSDQKQILWDLHYLTEGGFIITTNSDGRSVVEMSQMDGYPVISEFSTAFRNVEGVNFGIADQPKYLAKKPDSKAAFNAAVAKAQELDVALVNTGEELAQRASIKIEEKEQGIAAVFGSHAQLTDAATQIVEHAFKAANISSETHEIDYAGKDAREIKVKGASKADVIERLKTSELMQRPLKFAMGDSGSDWELMDRLGNGIVVGNAIADKEMQNINHSRIASDNGDSSKTWDFLKLLRDTYKAKARPALKSKHVRVG